MGRPPLGDLERLYWLKTALALGCLGGVLLSPRLWVASREYPLSPVWAGLPALAFPLDYAAFALLVALLTTILVRPRPRSSLIAFVVVAGAVALLDQSRWQPWFFQYLFMFAALAVHSWDEADAEGRASALDTCRFIVAATYFWSGAQKLNSSFAEAVLPWLLEPFAGTSGSLALALAVALGEAGVGVGLLVARARRLSVALVVGMHAFLLFALGPLGHNWNSVVWPWNATLAALAVTLFWHAEPGRLREILRVRRSAFRGAVLALFGVLPLLSFVGAWDAYLSAALYSGNVDEAVIRLSDGASRRLPEEVRRHVARAESAAGTPAVAELDLGAWAMGELNVVPYPAERVFKRIARAVCARTDGGSDVVLVIRPAPHFADVVAAERKYDCRALGVQRDRARRGVSGAL